MLQVYLLTEAFFILSAAVILADTFSTKFVGLINFRNFVYSKKIARVVVLILNCVLILGTLFFPIEPGPSIIGDFLPAVALVALLIFYLFRFSKDVNFIDVYKKYDALGYAILGVAFIHFLFPKFVIL